MTRWFYDSHDGNAYQVNILAWVGLQYLYGLFGTKTGTGIHEYSTQADMESAIKANHWPGPYINGTNNPSGLLGQEGESAAGTAQSAAGNLLNLPQFQNTRDFTMRAVKVVGGLMLLFVGLNMLAEDTVDVDVLTAVKALPKAAV
jgi:hypothetical protein